MREHMHNRSGRGDAALLVDCATCPVRGLECGDCMVTAWLELSPPRAAEPVRDGLRLDHREQAVVDLLLDMAMISPLEAESAVAQREAWGAYQDVG